MTNAKLPASLLSSSVPRKKTPVTTDYIIPIVEIVGTEIREFILYRMVDRYKILAWECVDRDKARHAYFQGSL